MRLPAALLLMSLALLPTLVQAELRSDIEYGRAGDVSLRLDASVPEGAGPFPIVIYLHGGGWNTGDKVGEVRMFADSLEKAGFVWLSVNYRLAPTHQWPACLDDVRTAIRWAHDHAAEFKGDPDRIAVMGYSAGGQLDLLAGATGGPDQPRLRAVVGLAPPSDFEQDLAARGGLSKSLQDLLNRPKEVDDASLATLRQIGPIHHVKPGLPPFLLMQGAGDKTVPQEQSINFQARCRAVGTPCDLILIPTAGHRLREWKEHDPAYQEKLVTWLSEKLAATPATRPAVKP